MKQLDAVRKRKILDQLDLRHGQMHEDWRYRNLFWVVDGWTIGHGDLRNEDIIRIHARLKDGQIFEGFNEHHMRKTMFRENPMLIITNKTIEYPDPVRIRRSTVKKLWAEL